MPTLAFCDSAWNGEQFEWHTNAEKFTVPLSAFRTEFTSQAGLLGAPERDVKRRVEMLVDPRRSGIDPRRM